MPLLYKQEENRPYRRYKHTAQEQAKIRNKGFTPVVSSNVSAIAQKNSSLYVRFHDASTYAYPKSGELFDKMLHSKSKGKFVWNELIRKNVPYHRASGLDFSTGSPMEDEAPINLMKQAEAEREQQIDNTSGLTTLLIGLALSTLINIDKATIAGFALATLINGNTTVNVDK